jgi:hypothetical protein
VAGALVTVAGLAMLVLPGPGLLVITLGLTILATEFVWPGRVLRRTSATAGKAVAALPAGHRLAGALERLTARTNPDPALRPEPGPRTQGTNP